MSELCIDRIADFVSVRVFIFCINVVVRLWDVSTWAFSLQRLIKRDCYNYGYFL